MVDVEAYLKRIGYSGPVKHDVQTLEKLQRTHMTAVPFENLSVFSRSGVRTDEQWSLNKIVVEGRGGWCFENNGAFAALLTAMGFDVLRLGAAVLLDGPSQRIDHLCLEVGLNEPHLVDVGFGDSFIRPLALNRRGPQDGGTGTFEFIASTQGLTLSEHVDGVPHARYRFKRVGHVMNEFDNISDHLSSDPTLHWSTKPFATRLLEGGPDRVTLLSDRLKITRAGETIESPVTGDDWDQTLWDWFRLRLPSNPTNDSESRD